MIYPIPGRELSKFFLIFFSLTFAVNAEDKSPEILRIKVIQFQRKRFVMDEIFLTSFCTGRTTAL
jgi:hypothetical protein